MHFEILHRTRYTYSRPVFLEPHMLRLRPRCDATQALLDHRLQVRPEPAGWSQWRDGEGNDAAVVWFDGLMEDLELTVQSTVRTLRSDPFDFILTEPAVQILPAVYPEPLRRVLAPCFAGTPPAVVRDVANGLLTDCDNETARFLPSLAGWLYEQCEVVIREEGEPLPAEVSLRERRGSCRDLAVAFNAVCSAVGLAARFVSGYQAGDPDQTRRYLHAWSEVYLPGGGWRGYDPTHGLAVADQHVALAASSLPGEAAPVQGNFRGTDATSSMEVHLHIETDASTPTA